MTLTIFSFISFTGQKSKFSDIIKSKMYFKTKLKKIPLSLVKQENTFFRFTDENPCYFNFLKSSIAKLGILNPIMVQPFEKKYYRVISGFRRLQIAKELGFTFIPARILRENLSPSEILTAVLLSHPHPLSLTEKVRIVRIMKDLGISPSQICTRFGSFLEIQSPHLLEKYIRLSNYTPSVLSYISTHGLSLNQALAFENLSSEEQNLLISLGTCLSLKGYDLCNILTDLKEIATKEEKNVAAILKETEILNVPKDVKLTRSQKIDKIKKILKMKRYPYLSRVNQKLGELKKRLRFKTDLKINWDPNLEGEVKLSFNIRHPDDVGKVVEDLLDKVNLDLISQFLRVYYEGLPDKKDMGGQGSKNPSSGKANNSQSG